MSTCAVNGANSLCIAAAMAVRSAPGAYKRVVWGLQTSACVHSFRSAAQVWAISFCIISLIRKIVPDKIRIAMFIVVIAGFVTMVDLLIQAFLPALAKSLGVFIPLIVVNCIILGRAEAFSYKNGVAASLFDGIFQGIGYTLVLLVMCVIREFLGAGTFGGGIGRAHV